MSKPSSVLAVTGPADLVNKLSRDSAVLSVGLEEIFLLEVPVEVVDKGMIASPTEAVALWPVQWDQRRIGAPAAWARMPVQLQATASVTVIDPDVMYKHPDVVGQDDASVATNSTNFLTPGQPPAEPST